MKRKKVIPKRGMPLLARTFPKFQLEVTALLVVGHGWTPKAATKAVRRWDKYVRRRWKEGKPPCAVADHLSKWRKEGSVCPCKGKKRDCARCRRGRGRVGRDAENPQEGELFESKRGNRWRVVSVEGDRYYVENEGRKTPGKLAWSRSNIKGMKMIEGKGPAQLSLFRDPSRSPSKGARFVQSLIFDRKVFTSAKAKAWALRHRFKASKIHATAQSYRIRQVSPLSLRFLKGSKIRTITLTKGVKAVIAVPRA